MYSTRFFLKSRANVIFTYKLVAIFTSVCCQVLFNTYHHKKVIFKILLCFSHMPCLLLLLNYGKSSPFPCRVKKSTLLRFVLLFISVNISWIAFRFHEYYLQAFRFCVHASDSFRVTRFDFGDIGR